MSTMYIILYLFLVVVYLEIGHAAAMTIIEAFDETAGKKIAILLRVILYLLGYLFWPILLVVGLVAHSLIKLGGFVQGTSVIIAKWLKSLGDRKR